MSNLNTHTGSLKYRPDVDGLRAVAVLSVIGFHFFAGIVRGGYVGVDVFFVISGYLISAIILKDIAANRFSIVAFYERRIRRIFPALFAMLALFAVVATIYMLPVEFVGFCKSFLAATFSASNFYFWKHSGYFDSPDSNPLLHTWSLAVEEQFYLFFPLFLLLIKKLFPSRLRIAVIVLFFGSLVASIVTVHYDALTAFYMPYTRVWELLMGTILSMGMFPRLPSVVLRNLVALAGMAMILYATIVYTHSTPFPGMAAVLPCLGSALIIGAGESGTSAVGAVLSWRPVVFVGLISYSLYLWHWPVLIMNKMGVIVSFNLADNISHRSGIINILLILISFVLATLSWRFVERPFRIGSLRMSGRPLFAFAAATMAAMMVFSVSTIASGGFEGRFSPQAIELGSYLGGESSFMRDGTCFISSNEEFDDRKLESCLERKPGKKTYLLAGDSHAAMLWYGLASNLPDENVLQATVSGCRPLIRESGYSRCNAIAHFVYLQYLPTHPVDGLLLEAEWQPEDIPGLGDTIAWAKEHHIPVILIGPMPEYDSPLPRLLAYSVAWHEPKLPEKHRSTMSSALDSRMRDMAENVWHVPYISLYQTICGSGNCIEFADAANTIPIMSDTNHLNEFGSKLVVKRIVDQGELQ